MSFDIGYETSWESGVTVLILKLVDNCEMFLLIPGRLGFYICRSRIVKTAQNNCICNFFIPSMWSLKYVEGCYSRLREFYGCKNRDGLVMSESIPQHSLLHKGERETVLGLPDQHFGRGHAIRCHVSGLGYAFSQLMAGSVFGPLSCSFFRPEYL